MKVYQAIAAASQAMANCIAKGNMEWAKKWETRLKYIVDNVLPGGNGFDAGTRIVSCADAKIVLETSFHHMNTTGMYDGWTVHSVTIRPSWTGFDVTVGGRDRNGIKDYIAEAFDYLLGLECAWDESNEGLVSVTYS